VIRSERQLLAILSELIPSGQTLTPVNVTELADDLRRHGVITCKARSLHARLRRLEGKELLRVWGVRGHRTFIGWPVSGQPWNPQQRRPRPAVSPLSEEDRQLFTKLIKVARAGLLPRSMAREAERILRRSRQ
jgi:hypothetical protein